MNKTEWQSENINEIHDTCQGKGGDRLGKGETYLLLLPLMIFAFDLFLTVSLVLKLGASRGDDQRLDQASSGTDCQGEYLVDCCIHKVERVLSADGMLVSQASYHDIGCCGLEDKIHVEWWSKLPSLEFQLTRFFVTPS
jgi:hypothetical protein